MRRHLDLLVAMALLIAAELEVALDASAVGGSDTVAMIGLPFIVAPLVWRRRAPLAAAGAMAAATLATALAGAEAMDPISSLATLLVMGYSVAAHAPLRPAIAGYLALVAATAIADGGDDLLFIAFVVLAPWVAGRLVADRTQQAEALRRLAVENAELAAQAERARLARELHDAVAHSVSVMVVQAGAAEQVLDSDPARARRALEAVQEAGRGAAVELRRMVGLLREGGEGASLSPAPGLAALQGLVEDARHAGLEVELRTAGEPVDLPAAVDLSAYRIVQEALTNVRKHAGARRVEVTVRHLAGACEIEVADDGRGPSANGAGGHGLAGMRERVALFGGSLDAGPGADGGFVVRARIPT